MFIWAVTNRSWRTESDGNVTGESASFEVVGFRFHCFLCPWVLDVGLGVNFRSFCGDEGGVWLYGGVDIGPEPVPVSHFVSVDVDACCTQFRWRLTRITKSSYWSAISRPRVCSSSSNSSILCWLASNPVQTSFNRFSMIIKSDSPWWLDSSYSSSCFDKRVSWSI